MKERVVADLSQLPLHGLGSASPTWWGSGAYMLIEGTGMALVVAVYAYLYSIAPQWPIGAPAPDLGPGTAILLLLVASVPMNQLLYRWASAGDLRKVRIGTVAMVVLSVVPMIVRVFEFSALNVSWDSNAYGSVVWLLLGMHTVHLLTDTIEWVVLAALMLTRHGDNKRRFGDVQDNTVYWSFVIVTWIVVYGCLYGIPRL